MEHIVEFFTNNVPIAYAFALFFCGAAAGSFLNVLIYRLPNDLSILSPPSACPKCGKHIFGLDNLPVLSWVMLGGKCRWCKDPISWRYPSIELLTGILWAILAFQGASYDFGAYQNSAAILAQLVFISCMIAVAFIDFDHQIIPDQISLGGLVAAIGASAVIPSLQIPFNQELASRFASVPQWALGLMGAFLGAAAGGGLVYLIRIIGTVIFRAQLRRAQEKDPEIDSAVGLGDVKLMAFIGAFLGWKAVLVAFFFGTILGSLGGIVDRLRTGTWPEPDRGKARPGIIARIAFRWKSGVAFIPFGPFLCAGAVILLLMRAPIMGWFEMIFSPGLEQ